MREDWNIPNWTNADRLIINGQTPDDFNKCYDPEGARLYLGLRARSSLQEQVLGIRRSSGLRSWIKNQIRWRLQSSSLLGYFGGFSRTNRKLYHKLNSEIPKYAGDTKHLSDNVKVNIRGISTPSALNHDLIRDLLECQVAIKESGGLIVVHGSQEDGNTTPYSDVDLLMFGNSTNRLHLQIKTKIESLILRVDPLQHHGVFFVDRSNLQAYWQMQLPLEVLRSSTVFIQEGVLLDFKVIREPYGALSALNGMLYSLESFLNVRQAEVGLWKWKYLLSQLMLLPTLTLGVKGTFIHKRDSFDLVKELYSEEAWFAMEEATRAREHWPDTYAKKSYINQKERISGRITRDPETVPDKIALWKDPKFTDSLNKYLEETKFLLNLHV